MISTLIDSEKQEFLKPSADYFIYDNVRQAQSELFSLCFYSGADMYLRKHEESELSFLCNAISRAT